MVNEWRGITARADREERKKEKVCGREIGKELMVLCPGK
jgi:hypothetical protein